MSPPLAVPGIGLPDLPNPFEELGEAAAKAAADGWTTAMLALWHAGLFLLRVVLQLMHGFLTPDLSAEGPGRRVYVYTFWIAAVLVVVMLMVQLATAAFRRDGQGLARVLIGSGQFVVVWAAWVGYGVALVAACGGLTTALMAALLGVNSWPEWDPFGGISTDDITDASVATVLGLLGLVLWIAAIGHLLVLLTRAAALVVLVATAPVCAAGLVSDAGRAWFWKSLRWFHAAAFTPVLMVLVLGLGVQLATGVAEGLTDGVQAAVATALSSVVLICVSAVSPLALFKLLAFVDPGTGSGSALRKGLAAQGGMQGLLSGKAAGADGESGSGAAATSDGNGRSGGESGAEDTTADRFTKTTQTNLASAGGPALATGLGLVQGVGSRGAAIGADLTNQMGVGHHAHQPDLGGTGSDQQNGDGSPRTDPDRDDPDRHDGPAREGRHDGDDRHDTGGGTGSGSGGGTGQRPDLPGGDDGNRDGDIGEADTGGTSGSGGNGPSSGKGGPGGTGGAGGPGAAGPGAGGSGTAGGEAAAAAG